MERAKTDRFTDYAYHIFPAVLWDLFGNGCHPIHTTVAEMGPPLLSQLLGLTEAQESVLNIAFRVADEQGLPLLDIKKLQSCWFGLDKIVGTLACGMGMYRPKLLAQYSDLCWFLKTKAGTRCLGSPTRY